MSSDFIIDVLEKRLENGWPEGADEYTVVRGPQRDSGPPQEMASVVRRGQTYTASYRPNGYATSSFFKDYGTPQDAVNGIRHHKRDFYKL